MALVGIRVTRPGGKHVWLTDLGFSGMQETTLAGVGVAGVPLNSDLMGGGVHLLGKCYRVGRDRGHGNHPGHERRQCRGGTNWVLHGNLLIQAIRLGEMSHDAIHTDSNRGWLMNGNFRMAIRMPTIRRTQESTVGGCFYKIVSTLGVLQKISKITIGMNSSQNIVNS